MLKYELWELVTCGDGSSYWGQIMTGSLEDCAAEAKAYNSPEWNRKVKIVPAE